MLNISDDGKSEGGEAEGEEVAAAGGDRITKRLAQLAS